MTAAAAAARLPWARHTTSRRSWTRTREEQKSSSPTPARTPRATSPCCTAPGSWKRCGIWRRELCACVGATAWACAQAVAAVHRAACTAHLTRGFAIPLYGSASSCTLGAGRLGCLRAVREAPQGGAHDIGVARHDSTKAGGLWRHTCAARSPIGVQRKGYHRRGAGQARHKRRLLDSHPRTGIKTLTRRCQARDSACGDLVCQPLAQSDWVYDYP